MRNARAVESAGSGMQDGGDDHCRRRNAEHVRNQRGRRRLSTITVPILARKAESASKRVRRLLTGLWSFFGIDRK
jgi:hypothetical protein